VGYACQAEDGSCTAMEYDLAKAKETRTQLLMGGCICIGVHYKFGYMQVHAHTYVGMQAPRRSPGAETLRALRTLCAVRT